MRRPLDQQSSGEFAPAVSATRTCHALVQANGYVAEIHVRARVYSQPFPSRAPSHRPRHVQDPSLRRHGGVEEACKLMSTNAGFLRDVAVTLTVPVLVVRPRPIIEDFLRASVLAVGIGNLTTGQATSARQTLLLARKRRTDFIADFPGAFELEHQGLASHLRFSQGHLPADTGRRTDCLTSRNRR